MYIQAVPPTHDNSTAGNNTSTATNQLARPTSSASPRPSILPHTVR